MKSYLIGYMGSGKSTLGYSLAESLGFKLIDLDVEFETKYKISISDFFKKYGESAFRELEHKLLTDFSNETDLVISTGGGTPCFHQNMGFMNLTGLTIYLKASPELLLQRIQTSARKRPLFQLMENNKPLQKITDHLQSRLAYYEQAETCIDAEKPDIPELKKMILQYSEKLNGL
jgi:shikimate kinase